MVVVGVFGVVGRGGDLFCVVGREVPGIESKCGCSRSLDVQGVDNEGCPEVVGGKARPVASFDARDSLEGCHVVGRIWHWPNATSLDAFGSGYTRFASWCNAGGVVGGVRRSSASLDARGTW